MLEELNVRNYALIENVSVQFTEGLNILSGETGAGKSILIGALGLILGGKGSADIIRSNAEEATVSGVIGVNNNREAQKWLVDHSIVPEDGTVIIRRIIKQTGRGSIYIQSSPVTRTDLGELAATLFDIHGQHEHQSLLHIEAHRKLTDRYGGHEDLAKDLHNSFVSLTEKKKILADLDKSEQELLRDIDLLQFAIKEIEEASVRAGEEEELEQEVSRLSQMEKLYELLDSFHSDTADAAGGAMTGFRGARSTLSSLGEIDTDLVQLQKRFDDAYYEIEDVVDSVRSYRNSLQFDPVRLDECQSRLSLIHRLEKKYGTTISDVVDYADSARLKLAAMENRTYEKDHLKDEIRESERIVLSKAHELSKKRIAAAGKLEGEISETLSQLGMPNAEFRIKVEQKTSEAGRPVCGPYGFDRLEFLISTNRGEPVKPLRSVASGGEMSRIMLAIKSVLADTDHIDSLIFDEIDAGIGGEVSVAVGAHLADLSLHKQVLCITHLAAIAARAGNHLTVEKREDAGRTITEVKSVAGEIRIREIARMLSGDKEAESSLRHASDLLEKYDTTTVGA